LLIAIRGLYKNNVHNSNFTRLFAEGGLAGHVDLPRIRAGGMGGAFWSAFVGCPANASDMTPASYAPVVRATLQQLDLFAQLHALHPTVFPRTTTAAAALEGFQARGSARRLIAPVGIEGLHQVGGSPATLRLYHALGARYATLTWNCHNAYADAAAARRADGSFGVAEPLWGGISPAGREMVLEMNRLGMLVDLAHVSAATMRDALAGSEGRADDDGWRGSVAPPIFSHSSAYALCPHPRNVPDDVLRLVKKRNSVVMINFSADFIACTPSRPPSGLPDPDPDSATLMQVVQHIMHIGELIGYDHVGIGSDYDGIELAPKGLEDVSKFPDLVAELLRQGISEKNVIKVIGGNILRVWREAEAVSDMMKLVRHPLEDDI
jgi:membrane dipeptidase